MLGTGNKYQIFLFLLYCNLLWRNGAEREEEVKEENLCSILDVLHLSFLKYL